MGLCISPIDPDVIYGVLDAQRGEGGVFRSVDRGESWEKRSGHMTTSPQYYNEIHVDPHDPDRAYATTRLSGLWRSADGGAVWTPAHKGLPSGAVLRLFAKANPTRQPTGRLDRKAHLPLSALRSFSFFPSTVTNPALKQAAP